MRSIPVAVDRLSLIAVVVSESLDPDGKRKSNQMGEPLWKCQLMATELLDVTVPGARPEIQPLQAVEVENLVARAWAMDGRSGVSFSATSIRLAAPATNGRKPVPAATVGEA